MSAAPLAVALGVTGPSAWQPQPVPPPVPPPVSPVPISVTARVEVVEFEEVDSAAAKRAAKTRPTCPQCRGSSVKTLGGGTKGKYRYTCQSCSTNWQQVPPHRLEASVPNEAGVVGFANRKRTITITSAYKCHRCGQPKKGHICSVVDNATEVTAHDAEVCQRVTAAPPPPPRVTGVRRAHCRATLACVQVLSVSATPTSSIVSPPRPPQTPHTSQLSPPPPLAHMPPFIMGELS